MKRAVLRILKEVGVGDRASGAEIKLAEMVDALEAELWTTQQKLEVQPRDITPYVKNIVDNFKQEMSILMVQHEAKARVAGISAVVSALEAIL